MKQLSMTEGLYKYMLDVSLMEHPVLQALREETDKHPLAAMQTAPEQAQFMQFLLRLIGARKVLELGTFTGYGSLAMALALPDNAQLITCDINEEWTAHAAEFWRKAGQAEKIELKIAPALDSMNALLDAGAQASFDFIFIDADKTNYIPYYERALRLIKPKGIIAVDNVFWGGKVIDTHETGAQTREIRRLNQLIKNDNRVYSSLIPIADGLFLIQLK